MKQITKCLLILLLSSISSAPAFAENTVHALDAESDVTDHFVRTGQAPDSKYVFDASVGVNGSGGLVVGDSGYSGQYVSLTAFPVKDGEEMVMSVDFKFGEGATRDQGTPLYLGVCAQPAYEPGMASNDDPNQNHILVGLLRSAEKPGSSSKPFVQNKVAGTVSNSAYGYEDIFMDTWYRFTVKLTKVGDTFSGSGILSVLSDVGEVERVAEEIEFAGLKNPQLDQDKLYVFFGGQGKSVSSGLVALDNISVPDSDAASDDSDVSYN